MKKYIPSEEEIKTILKMYNDDLIGSQTISEKIGLNKQIGNAKIKRFSKYLRS